ncbi:MAG: helix-turn-helix transcriptional regulator [Sandaracinus sp.]|nr:helix-turn-helix transcriptional regulator [Sandaracinus sp.]MCB9636003.1 helix-turn-helix transcriptional regulator [Sandaracinus sp.]
MARIHLWSDRVLTVARLGRVAMHAHAAPALLFAVDGPFGLRLDGGRFEAVENVFLPAGRRHELACEDARVGVLHLAPGAADLGNLAPERSAREALRAVFEGELAGIELAGWVNARVGPPPRRRARDLRIDRAARRIAESAYENLPLATLADEVGLSPSRLQHLFRQELGITPRQLRTWRRLHEVARRVSEGETLTRAGLEAGFVDSAHASHAFRRFLGISPSRVLTRGSHVHVHP